MNLTMYSYYYEVRDHLNKTADSISNQSLADLQYTLREAASCIKQLAEEVRTLQAEKATDGPYYLDR